MGLIDTHTHLETFARAGRLEETLKRAREAGVDRLVTIGTSPDDWNLYRDLAEKHPGTIDYTVGIHPCSVDEGWEAAMAQVEGFWQSQRPPVGLGEIGLDRYHLPKDDPAKAEAEFGRQLLAFRAGLSLARALNCPVVIHSRGAMAECIRETDASRVDWRKVVFHCFVENVAEIRELNRRGGRGSFTGILTYKNADSVRAAAREQGIERMMLETDAPYLTPMPHRGKPNEPAYLRHTAEYAAQWMGLAYEELARVTTANACAFYGLQR